MLITEILLGSLCWLLVISLTVAAQNREFNINLEDKAVKKVAPTYPPLAKRKRVQGKVMVGLKVDANGTVSAAEFLDGNALFKPASLEAAQQWIFQKSANGVSGYIVFRFQLEDE
jgi:TonB family protein